MENGEQFLRIGPDMRELKTGRGGERDEPSRRVFVGKFGDDFFAGAKMKFFAAEMHCLLARAEQMHFDSADFSL